MKTHTQDTIVVYTTFEEKRDIKEYAKTIGKSMSKYLLDLHLKNIKQKEKTMLLHNDIGICENHAHDFDMDGFKGCVACLMYEEINKLKKIIDYLKTYMDKNLCTCMTKSPQIEYHKSDCLYRIEIEGFTAFGNRKELSNCPFNKDENSKWQAWITGYMKAVASHIRHNEK